MAVNDGILNSKSNVAATVFKKSSSWKLNHGGTSCALLERSTTTG